MKSAILRVILGRTLTEGQLRLMLDPQCLQALAGGLCFTKASTLLPPGRTTTGSGAPSWPAASPPSTSWSTPSTTSFLSCRSPGWPAPSCTLDTPWSWLSSSSYSLVCIVQRLCVTRTTVSSPVWDLLVNFSTWSCTIQKLNVCQLDLPFLCSQAQLASSPVSGSSPRFTVWSKWTDPPQCNTDSLWRWNDLGWLHLWNFWHILTGENCSVNPEPPLPTGAEKSLPLSDHNFLCFCASTWVLRWGPSLQYSFGSTESSSTGLLTLESCLVPYSLHIQQHPILLIHSPVTFASFLYSMHVQAKLKVWGERIKTEESCFLIAATVNSSRRRTIQQIQCCLVCLLACHTLDSLMRPRVASVFFFLPSFLLLPLRNSGLIGLNNCIVVISVYKEFSSASAV